MYVVDDVRRISALHVEIDFLLLEESRQIRQCGSYDDLALYGGERRKLARHITDEIAEVIFDFFLVYGRDRSQSDGFIFQSRWDLSPRVGSGEHA